MCVHVGNGGEGGTLRVGCQCGLARGPVVRLGDPTLCPLGSLGPGHRSLQVTGTCCLAAPRLRTRLGGGGRSLAAKRHKWRCLAGWVPHSRGRGAYGAVEGVPGHAKRLPSPGNLPGMAPGLGATAPLVSGALRAHYRTGLYWERGRGSRGVGEGSRGEPPPAGTKIKAKPWPPPQTWFGGWAGRTERLPRW